MATILDLPTAPKIACIAPSLGHPCGKVGMYARCYFKDGVDYLAGWFCSIHAHQFDVEPHTYEVPLIPLSVGYSWSSAH